MLSLSKTRRNSFSFLSSEWVNGLFNLFSFLSFNKEKIINHSVSSKELQTIGFESARLLAYVVTCKDTHTQHKHTHTCANISIYTQMQYVKLQTKII